MPRAVLDYLETRDYNFVLAAQKNINAAYIADMAKYATANETAKIMGAAQIPFYWESQGRAEVDFLIGDCEGNIIPLR
jgi:hypothetical protein